MMPTTSAAANPLEINIDIALQDPAWEGVAEVEALADKAVRAALELAELPEEADGRELELSLVLANDDLVRVLNREYRGKDKPTNVLSFAAFDDDSMPDIGGPAMLGDVILAIETIRREADEQDKPFTDHLTHLCVHGTLHLLGYDHMDEDEAAEMEELEIRILARLGVDNPYTEPLEME